MKTNILILCTGNSCRSQMMQGWLNYFDEEGRLQVYSAGIETHGVNPNAVRVMKEAGVDISHHTSNHIDEYRDVDFEYIITVCDHAKENCPWFPSGAKRIHQSFTDPAGATGTQTEILVAFRKTRDAIRNFSKEFITNQKTGQ